MARVSERSRFESTGNRIAQVREWNDNVQETAVSGRKLRKVSDDPVATVKVFRNRTKLSNIDQFKKSMDFSRGFLSKIEDSLMSMNETLIRARELCVQQANATWDGKSRSIVAEEVRQLADHLVSLGNANYADRYVFGGFQTSTPPVAGDGTFAGDDGTIFVQLDDNTYRPVNISGRDIFDVSPENEGKEKPIVKTLRDLYMSLKNNEVGGIQQSIVHIDKGMDKLLAAVAVMGARRTAVEDIAQRLDLTEIGLLTDNNRLESADPVESAMDLKRAETAVGTTLASTQKILSQSLMDFLK